MLVSATPLSDECGVNALGLLEACPGHPEAKLYLLKSLIGLIGKVRFTAVTWFAKLLSIALVLCVRHVPEFAYFVSDIHASY